MAKVNFQKELDDLIAKLDGKRPDLLLHACCGPCSSYCLEYLTKYFEITVYYYNPNIYPPQEYHRRLEELKTLYTTFPPALKGKVKVVEAEYNPQQYFDAIGIKENPELAKEPEKGERCRRCYKFRLERAYNYAKANNFDYFCTTLSISPFKDAVKINVIGQELAAGGVAVEGFLSQGDGSPGANKNQGDGSPGANKNQGDGSPGFASLSESEFQNNGDRPLWLPSDFKKNGGFVRSLEISEEYNMYRQDYCGCIYSYQSRQEWLARACSGAKQPD